jgi:hypothetical protein
MEILKLFCSVISKRKNKKKEEEKEEYIGEVLRFIASVEKVPK